VTGSSDNPEGVLLDSGVRMLRRKKARLLPENYKPYLIWFPAILLFTSSSVHFQCCPDRVLFPQHRPYLPFILHPYNPPVRQLEFSKKRKDLPLPNVLQAKDTIITAATI
jgi:hypothetical protein